MPSQGIKNVFGGTVVDPNRSFGDPTLLKEQVFPLLLEGDCRNIDTAALYGQSETILGQARACEQFTIDTKMRGGFGGPGYATKSNVIKEAEKSWKLLETPVDIYYLHAPDSETDIAETLAGIDEMHKRNFFARFGLSNFKSEDVRKIHRHCEKHKYVKPSVYQGIYSPVARKQEEVLFPTLRELNISFYAYSPVAGGFLTKSKQDIEDGKGRFSKDNPLSEEYLSMYNRPRLLDALEMWNDIAKAEGVPKAELAYRWVKYNSELRPENGDAIIIGASSVTQLKQTLNTIGKGPLSAKTTKKIDEMWESIKEEAPLDSFHR